MIIGGKRVGVMPASISSRMKVEKNETFALAFIEPFLVGAMSSFIAYCLLHAAKKATGNNNDNSNNDTTISMLAGAAIQDATKDCIKEHVKPVIADAVRYSKDNIRSAYDIQAEMDYKVNVEPRIRSKL